MGKVDNSSRFCWDCKYFISPGWFMMLTGGKKYGKCGVTMNYGSGEAKYHCSTQRDPEYDKLHTCGSMGRWFVPRDAENGE